MMTGAQLKHLRERLGITQKLLSEATAIFASNISGMENGARPIGAKLKRRLRSALRKLSRGEFRVSRLAARQARAVLGGKGKGK